MMMMMMMMMNDVVKVCQSSGTGLGGAAYAVSAVYKGVAKVCEHKRVELHQAAHEVLHVLRWHLK
eukprot:11078277-Karenia_brevis.AAC.1